jgi:morphogenetic protein associated with SpoVID
MADKTFEELEAEAKAEAVKKATPKKEAPKKEAPKKEAPKKYKKGEELPFDEVQRRMQLQKKGPVVVSGRGRRK